MPWVLLEASLIIRRKPLYYIVNLVIPTSVITLVAIAGFFTPASTSNERREKLSLGIDSVIKKIYCLFEFFFIHNLYIFLAISNEYFNDDG